MSKLNNVNTDQNTKPVTGKKNILFKMTGSIACYKACQLISKLTQNNFDVQVVASPSALQFIGPSTLEGLSGRPALYDMYEAGRNMDHIHLMRWADLIIVAPATAHFINRISQGIGDDLLSTLFLAHDFKKPYLIAPAMNHAMYDHPATQESILKLKKMGIEILDTDQGMLACGEMGRGRLINPDTIFDIIVQKTSQLEKPNQPENNQHKHKNQFQKILITSGGTEEPIDDVRFITNKSTGTTGAYLADFLDECGFEVDFLYGASSKKPQSQFCHLVSFTDFKSYQNKLNDLLAHHQYHAVIHLAALSDFSVKKTEGKIKSDSGPLTLELLPNPKAINAVKRQQPKTLLFGFKLTSTQDSSKIDQAVQKVFQEAQADFVVHNDINQISSEQHVFHIYNKNKNIIDAKNKTELAQIIANKIFEGGQ